MLKNSLILEQKQILSAQQIQSLEILAYTNQELESFLTKEYLENPLLDNAQDKQDTLIQNLEEMYEKNQSFKDYYLESNDGDFARQQDIPAQNSDVLPEHLLRQLNETNYTKLEWTVFQYLIYCLNEDGFFEYEPTEIALVLNCPVSTIEYCLNILKELEPAGIFSKDISECILIQAKKQGVHDQKLFTLIKEYMPEILKGQIGTVSRKLKLSTSQIKEYIYYIGQFNPRPLVSASSIRPEYIVPDILVTYESDQWLVQLNDNWMGEYKFNDYYIHMMKTTTDESLKQYFRIKYERTKYIINCIEQRRRTIITVVKTILQIQDSYFRFGHQLLPMSLEDIADQSGFHVSTISRAIKDKYLQYRKTILIKDLFTSATISNDNLSALAVKQTLAKIIKNEPPENPFTDSQIAEQMHERGINISRRTVTKYRKQLEIPDSRQRLYLK